MNELLSEALRYLESGKSIIPVDHRVEKNKAPLMPWKKYQAQLAEPEEVERWFKRWPDAMIGSITGKISHSTVIDTDPPDGEENLAPYLPENCETPTIQTPRDGRHRIFEYFQLAPNRSGIGGLVHVDCKNDGGYHVLPPSRNSEGGKYVWLIPPDACESSPFPNALINKISFSLYRDKSQLGDPKSQKSQESQKVTIDFSEGKRNDSLFTVANTIIKGGMNEANAMHLLMELNSLCKPSLPEKEIERIFKSALDRSKRRERNIRGEVREFISVTDGDFSVTDCYIAVTSVTSEEKAAVRQALVQFSKDPTPIIERVGTRSGWYRPLNESVEYMDFLNAATTEFPVILPLGIGDYVKLYPGNIIIVAGAKGGAKTTFMMNLTKLNQDRHDITYFNSEMGDEELKIRLLGHKDIPLTSWTKKFIKRSHDWHDIIKPSENTIWIIDYMEPPEDKPYIVGAYIKQIHEKMGGKGLCFIGLQKPSGRKYGLGGRFTTDKARAYLSLDYDSTEKAHRIEIVDAKAWKGPRNPRDLFRYYQIADQGARYTGLGCWQEEK